MLSGTAPIAYGAVTLCGTPFQVFPLKGGIPSVLPQPQDESWFGLVRFRSPLLAESMSVSFPPGTEMFQFPGFAPHTYEFSMW